MNKTSVPAEIEIKTERLQKMLSAENLGGILLNSQANFAWLTGGKSNFINSSIESGACSLFIRDDGKRFVFASNIEMPRLLAEEISGADFEPVEYSWQEEKFNPNLIFEKANSLLEKNATLGSDLPLHKAIKPSENLISRCRYELTGAEIGRYISLGKDAGIALGNIFKLINPGETEFEIARKTRDELAKFDINPIVTLVAADARIARFRHPIPTANIWKQTILIVVCAKRGGLIASLSRLAHIGKIPGDLNRKNEACAAVFAKILSETKRGKTGAELYGALAEAYTEKGFGDEINKHHQGGAAGYKSREWVAHPQSAEIVRKNQAFAWNPSITGTKAEETALLIDDEIQIITSTPDFPQIRVEIAGIEYFSPDILSL